MEFQAIVLAGGKGSRMNEITKGVPKCLLPIGNKPMIWYPVRYLEKSGFTEIIILTLSSIQKRVEDELSACGIRARLNVVGIDDQDLESDDGFGTANALYLIKDKIFTDCVVLSCDLITNVNLQQIANLYRKKDASFLMLINDIVEQNIDLPLPGSKSKYTPEVDYIGFDEATNRLLYFNSADDVKSDAKSEFGIKIKPSILKKYPNITLTGRVQDAHLYFIKKCLIDYMIENNKTIQSIKGDFLPLICRKQFSKHRVQKSDNDSDSNSRDRNDIYDYIKNDNMSQLVGSYSASNQFRDLISCYYYLQTDGICLRANNLAVYLEANKQANKILPFFPSARKERTESVSRFDRTQIGNDSIIGDSTTIGDKAMVKKSVIGKNCVIGENAKIFNSVILDSVTISSNVIMNGSIICNNCKIAKSEIKDSIVEYKLEVEGGKLLNETYSDWNI